MAFEAEAVRRSPESERAGELVNAARAHERASRRTAEKWIPRAVSGSLNDLAIYIRAAEAHDDAVIRVAGTLKYETWIIEAQ